jgi:hypothetical protein
MGNEQQRVRWIRQGTRLQTGDNDTSARRHFQDFVRDALFYKYRGNIFCDRSFVARRIYGINAYQIAEPTLRFIGQLVQVRGCHGRLRVRTERSERDQRDSQSNSASTMKHFAFLRTKIVPRSKLIHRTMRPWIARLRMRACVPRRKPGPLKIGTGIAESFEHPGASWQHRMCKINTFVQAGCEVQVSWH